MAKAFDLEAAKAGAPLVTRDGLNARFISHVPELCEGHRIHIAIDGKEVLAPMYENGEYIKGEEHKYDLFMAPVMTTVYVNLYDSDIPNTDDCAKRAAHFPTKEDAEQNARCNIWHLFAVAVPVEIEA